MTVQTLGPARFREAGELLRDRTAAALGRFLTAAGRAAVDAHFSEGRLHARRGSSVLLGAFDGETLAGVLELQKPGRVSALAVRPAFRGRGAAELLLVRAAVQARSWGAAELTLNGPPGALWALRQMGFSTSGPVVERFGAALTPMRRPL